MNEGEQEKKIQQIIAKAWTDEGFKQRLLSDAGAVFKEEGLEIPEGVEVRMVANTDKVIHFVLPVKPVDDELSNEQLTAIAGGYVHRVR